MTPEKAGPRGLQDRSFGIVGISCFNAFMMDLTCRCYCWFYLVMMASLDELDEATKKVCSKYGFWQIDVHVDHSMYCGDTVDGRNPAITS